MCNIQSKPISKSEAIYNDDQCAICLTDYNSID